MRWSGGLAKRFIADLACLSLLFGAVAMSSLEYGVGRGERQVYEAGIGLVVQVECGRGCTFILDPADQKAIAGGGIAAWTAYTARACGANVACNAVALAGAGIATMYVSEYGSDTCDMHIRIRPTGVTTAVIVTHELQCAGTASPGD